MGGTARPIPPSWSGLTRPPPALEARLSDHEQGSSPSTPTELFFTQMGADGHRWTGAFYLRLSAPICVRILLRATGPVPRPRKKTTRGSTLAGRASRAAPAGRALRASSLPAGAARAATPPAFRYPPAVRTAPSRKPISSDRTDRARRERYAARTCSASPSHDPPRKTRSAEPLGCQTAPSEGASS